MSSAATRDILAPCADVSSEPRETAAALPLTRPVRGEAESAAFLAALASNKHSGGGTFTRACHAALEAEVPGSRAFLTTSCTAALEMAGLLLQLAPGDEVIMPSWTFCSTANAVALRGAVPVFVDVLDETLNIDPACVEAAVTPRTRAILCVHYAGVGCDMNALLAICARHSLVLIEDAAQAIGASWRNRPLGSFGAMAAFSFHDTKNLSCGEGGALLINDASLVRNAECAWEKGTDRLRFERGEVRKYNWVTLGSSYLPSELNAAILSVQLERLEEITAARLRLWQGYHMLLEPLEDAGLLRRPSPPAEATHNAHIYFVRLDPLLRDAIGRRLRAEGIGASSHYEPLHLAPAGRQFARAAEPRLPVTEAAAASILRLPLYPGMLQAELERVVERLLAAISAERQAARLAPALRPPAPGGMPEQAMGR
jgi:dTDP-4-amino-4,6-dideoxygalactose transaminase